MLPAVCGSSGFESRSMSLVESADVSNDSFASWAIGSFCGDVDGSVQVTGPSERESE